MVEITLFVYETIIRHTIITIIAKKIFTLTILYINIHN